MKATAGTDSGMAKRVLIGLFLCYVIGNHAVRAAARSGFGGAGGLGSFASDALPMTVQTLDGFRRETGESLGSLAHICPGGTAKYCSLTARGIRVILGLH